MFLGNSLSAATSGLDSVERQLAVVSQNVSNANTPNYVRQTVPLTSLGTAGGPAGVRAGVTQREMDEHLQGDVFAALAKEEGSDTISSALASIDQISGTPGSGQDISSLFGALRDAFSTLATDPSSGSQQLDVIGKAGEFADGLHTLSDALVSGRQNAQDTLQHDVTTANDTLHQIGQLSDQIIAARAAGQSTADLENARDGQLRTLAQLTGAKFIKQPTGDVTVIGGNTVMPTRVTSGPFSLATANFDPATPAASVPALQLNGVAVATLGGEMGANLDLRDKTLPGMQAQLDQFAQSVASSFSGQGLRLFTDPAGNVPTAGTVGTAGSLQVSAAVQATPTMVRDGSNGASTAGNTTLIDGVLQTVFNSSATGLPEQATSLVAGFAQVSSQAAAAHTTNSSVRSGLESRLSAVTGVSVDSELAKMVQLQLAYAANAKVVTAVQNMWTDLLGTMR